MSDLVMSSRFGVMTKEQAEAEAKLQASIKEDMGADSYLPSLRLVYKTSAAFEKGLAKPGDYMMHQSSSDENGKNLTSSVPAILLGYYQLALDFSDKKNIVRSTDPESSEYKEIKANALKAKYGDGVSFGLQTLFLLPGAGLEGKDVFVTYYMANKSARRATPQFMALKERDATLTVNFVENETGRFPVPVLTLANQPIILNVSDEVIADEVAKFFANKDGNFDKETGEAKEESADARGGREV